MTSISIKDIDHTHISKVVKFTIPDPSLAGYKTPVTPTVTVVGTLNSFVRNNSGAGITLHVGNSKYSIGEATQEYLEISFPSEV